jgi:hypothetical protein
MTQLEPFWQKPFSLVGSIRATFEHVEQKPLSDQLVFLHESCLYLGEEFSLLPEYVNSAAVESKRFPVLCLSSNYHPCDKIKKILDSSIGNENYFILVTDPKFGVDKNTAVWPEFLISMSQLYNFQIAQAKKYRISYLSGGVRYHRLQLWQQIQPYITDQDIVVANRFGIENFENTFNHARVSLTHARACLQQWLDLLPWANRSELVDNQDQTLINAVDPWDNSHPAYNAMVNITGETLTDDDFMITEKTWKAYRSGCLVVNSGPTHVPAYLKKLGLEIWEEYDACLPTIEKILLIKELFQQNNIADIYHSHKEMIQHNQDLVSNMNFIKSQTVTAVEKLQALL